MKLYIHDANNLYEQDVEIEVKHEGILEVPEGKNVDDLPMSHFEKLAKKKGLSKITKALNNLQVWNKNDDPELSKWAGNMIDKLNKKLKKDESFVRISEAKPRQIITVDIPKKEYDFHFKGVDQDGWKREVNRVQVIYGHKGQFVELVLIDDNGVRLSSARKKFKIIENDIVLTDYDKKDIVIGKIDKIDTNESFIKETGEIPIGWKERTITVDDDEQEATVEEILSYAKRDNDRIEWDIDYNGGMFGGGRVFYIYSDGDTFSEVQYTVEQMKDDAVYGRGVYEAVKHSHYGSSPESRRKEVSDRFGGTFTPDDHMLVCKDGKILNIQIGKKYRCTAFDGQRVEIVDIDQIIDGDDGDSAMIDVVYRNKRYTVTSNQLYESLNEADYAGYYDPFDYQTWETVHIDKDMKQAFIDGIHKLGLEWKLGHYDRKSDTVELRIFATQDELAELAEIADKLYGRGVY